MRFTSLIVAGFALFAQPFHAAFVVVANHTEQPIACRVIQKARQKVARHSLSHPVRRGHSHAVRLRF